MRDARGKFTVRGQSVPAYVWGLLKILNPVGMVVALWRGRKAALFAFDNIRHGAPSDPIERANIQRMGLMGWFLLLWGADPNISLVVMPMTDIMPLGVWIGLFWYLSFAQMYALLTRCRSGRRHTSLVVLLVWGFILLATIAHERPVLATVFYLAICLDTLWAYRRIGRLPKEHEQGRAGE
jgi:hypothetical protein